MATEKIPSQTTHGLNDVSVAAAAAAAAKKVSVCSNVFCFIKTWFLAETGT